MLVFAPIKFLFLVDTMICDAMHSLESHVPVQRQAIHIQSIRLIVLNTSGSKQKLGMRLAILRLA